jgi:hypothetical protein
MQYVLYNFGMIIMIVEKSYKLNLDTEEQHGLLLDVMYAEPFLEIHNLDSARKLFIYNHMAVQVRGKPGNMYLDILKDTENESSDASLLGEIMTVYHAKIVSINHKPTFIKSKTTKDIVKKSYSLSVNTEKQYEQLLDVMSAEPFLEIRNLDDEHKLFIYGHMAVQLRGIPGNVYLDVLKDSDHIGSDARSLEEIMTVYHARLVATNHEQIFMTHNMAHDMTKGSLDNLIVK